MTAANERYKLNKELAQMLKGGVIMDVTTPEQAKIAEEAGACAVMALERIPADIRAAGGVSRMSDPKMIKGIQEAVSIPVMAKCRIGHFVEAQILEAIEIDYIDESEVLSPADDVFHIDKRKFKVPFVCGAKDLGEALRRINEGASMIRTKGEPGTGDVVQAVRHMRAMNAEGRKFKGCLYFGLMLTSDGPKVIEYNCRFGDPETQVVLPRLKTDFVDIITAVAEERLSQLSIEWSEEACACVVMASGGYPGSYPKGIEIHGLDENGQVEGAVVYHAGTRLDHAGNSGKRSFLTNGGRVLGVTAQGKTLPEALKNAYAAVEKISFDGAMYRKDIGSVSNS